ncbi:uncharacterized protein PG986_002404 [Apiospora aurea]|uniref:2EXR domain-containing protein n=1 Tax=Apiospora aurea TaxID=335848 RepID=A0ABR1QNR0_9PEZI
MKTCKDFSQLPAELRLAIWAHTLQEEASSRLVLVHQTHHHVLPFNYLVSPLLSVNSEAREAALKFYEVHLPVRPVLPDHLDAPMVRGCYIDTWRKYPYAPTTGNWQESAGKLTAHHIDESLGEETSCRKVGRGRQGMVYLSTQHYCFVQSCDIWVDTGTLCHGGRDAYDYKRLDIIKAHIMQVLGPDFTGVCVEDAPKIAKTHPTENDPVFPTTRSFLSDSMPPDQVGQIRDAGDYALLLWAGC